MLFFLIFPVLHHRATITAGMVSRRTGFEIAIHPCFSVNCGQVTDIFSLIYRTVPSSLSW